MQVPATTVPMREPFRDLRSGMSRQVVEHDVHAQSARHVGVDLFEEPQHVGAGVAFAQIGHDLAGGDVHCGE